MLLSGTKARAKLCLVQGWTGPAGLKDTALTPRPNPL